MTMSTTASKQRRQRPNRKGGKRKARKGGQSAVQKRLAAQAREMAKLRGEFSRLRAGVKSASEAGSLTPYEVRVITSLVNFLDPKGRKPLPRMTPTNVGLFDTKAMVQLPYGQMTDTSDPRRGLAGVISLRSAVRPGMYLTFPTLAAAKYATAKTQTTNPDIMGFWPINPGGLDESESTGVLHVDNSGFVNAVGLVTYEDEGNSPGRTMQMALDPTDNPFYGIPVDFQGATDITVLLSGVTAGIQFPVGLQFTVEFCSTTNTAQATTAALATATANISNLPCTLVGGVATLGGRYACATPQNPFGVRIRASQDVDMKSFQWSIQLAAGTQCRWKYVTNKQQSQVETIYDTVSVVGGGLFCSYVGSTLLDGGQSAMINYRGGTSATLEGLNSADQVAESLEGRPSTLRQGHLCPMKPARTEDLAFYELSDELTCLSLSQQAIYWSIADLTQKSVLRVFFVTLCEGTSTSPLVRLEKSPASPQGEARIIAALQNFPDRVDNPKHWEAIKDFVKAMWNGVGAGAAHVQSFYKQHQGWIDPLAASLGAAAVALI